MARGKPCSICTSPDRLAIDGKLLAGVKQKTVAEQFPGLSRFALSRHWRLCIPTSSAAVNVGDDDSQEIGRWLLRAEEIFNAAAINGDIRGQVGALGAALKSLEMRSKTKERERESEVRDLPDNLAAWSADEESKFIAYFDSVLARASETPHASPEARWMGLEIRLEKDPELLTVLQRTSHDPGLR
jgi:hypothetical protein